MKKLRLIFSQLLGFCYVSKVQTITIGTQVWMKENLNVDHFRNGDPIPEARTAEEWKKAGDNKQPVWCYYENRSVQDDPVNGTKYGKLYNWYAVNDPRGLAPLGWHVPSDDEWTILTNYLGGEKVAGKKMKSKSGWQKPDNGGNNSGFAGLPGGIRESYRSCIFENMGKYGIWWSSTELNTDSYAWSRNLYFIIDNVGRHSKNKGYGFSVRCLRD